jgi:hypothetical protein
MGNGYDHDRLAGSAKAHVRRIALLFRSGHRNGLMLRLAFHLPLRQTEGLMASIFELLEVPLCVSGKRAAFFRLRAICGE